jgi:hypothetical protein
MGLADGTPVCSGGSEGSLRAKLGALSAGGSLGLHHHPRVTVEWGFDHSAEVKFRKQPFTTPGKSILF